MGYRCQIIEIFDIYVYNYIKTYDHGTKKSNIGQISSWIFPDRSQYNLIV